MKTVRHLADRTVLGGVESRRRTVLRALLLVGALTGCRVALPAPAPVPVDRSAEVFADDSAVCPDFAVRVVRQRSAPRSVVTTRVAGDTVEVVEGPSDAVTLYNLATGGSVHLSPHEMAMSTTTHADGSQDVMGEGWHVVLLFETDLPAGPSATLHTGVVAFRTSAAGVRTLDHRAGHGPTRDLCAELATAPT